MTDAAPPPEPVEQVAEAAAKVVAAVEATGRKGLAIQANAADTDAVKAAVDQAAEALGGLGEGPHDELPAVLARYRVFLSPIRYSSLSLAVCEAMTIGLPVVGLATTELVTVVNNGVSGYLETSVELPEEEEARTET